MFDPDLKGVDPSRRGVIKRRVDAIRRYLDLDAPTFKDDDAFARELGICRNHFLMLVRSWEIHGRADALPGARRRQERRTNPGSCSAEAIMAQALREAPGASVASIHRRAVMLAAAAGLPRPSWTAVAARVHRSGPPRAAPDMEGKGTIVLGRCATDLRIRVSADRVVPLALAIAVRIADRAILAVETGTADQPPDLLPVIRRLTDAASDSASDAQYAVVLANGRERRLMKQAVSGLPLEERMVWKSPLDDAAWAVQSVLAGKLGPMRLSGLRRKDDWALPRHLNSALGEPVDLDEAAAIVEEAVEMHNGAAVEARR